MKNVEAALLKLDKQIQYYGIHYTGAQNYPSKIISEEEFKTRWQKFATIASELN